MSGYAKRKSVMAFVPETTEGTLVAPSAATQYSAFQADWTTDPGQEFITPAEMRNSLGDSKPIPGFQNPTCGGSHYLRASGTAGTAPDWNDLMKAFLGTEVTNSTEYDTVAGSTTSVVNVDSGEGANFQRGHGLLIKDNTNGWRIRVVHSVSTDALSLSFQVPTAPASGVNLGKAVFWKPAESGHQTLSVWYYIANGAAVEAISGCRVTDFVASASAGALPTAKFGLEGLNHYLNPIQITASTKYIDWTNDDGTFAAQVPTGDYAHPAQLATALQTVMNAISTGETHTVSYSNSTGKFTFTCTGTVLTLKWNTGTNTANSIAAKVGFSTAADSSGTAATTGYTSTNAYTLTSPYTPTLDSAEAYAAKNQEIMIGDASDYTCFDSPSVEVSSNLDRAVQESLCAESGRSGAALTGRHCTIKVRKFVEQYDSQMYGRMIEGTTTRFQWSWGRKASKQWVGGECGYVYCPAVVVKKWQVTEENGAAMFDIELQTFVGTDQLAEMYVGTL